MSRRYRVIHQTSEVTAEAAADGVVLVDDHRFHVSEISTGQYRVTGDDGASTLVAVAGPPHETWTSAGGCARTCVVDGAPKRAAASRAAASDMTAPMPATVVKVVVAVGERVAAGTPVIVLEAMKMELTVRAARDGVVRAIGCAVGDLVKPGVRLVEIEA